MNCGRLGEKSNHPGRRSAYSDRLFPKHIFHPDPNASESSLLFSTLSFHPVEESNIIPVVSLPSLT